MADQVCCVWVTSKNGDAALSSVTGEIFMEFVPKLVEGGIILNAVDVCTNPTMDCKFCPDIAVGIHNWFVANGLKYLVVDFQDEKDICATILIELLQLRKRLRFPFLLVGIMERPAQFLVSYAYSGYPFFLTPEEAISYLKENFPMLIDDDTSGIEFGSAIHSGRFRGGRFELENDDGEEEAVHEI